MLALLQRGGRRARPPARLDVVDIGAGQGELLSQAAGHGRSRPAGRRGSSRTRSRSRPGRPGSTSGSAGRAAPPAAITGLVIASEWLDNVPLDVAELTPDGPRLVLVDTGTGAERSRARGRRPADLAWLAAWWPLREPGDRAELGRPRCAAWAGVVGRLARGLAVAADYGHRRAGRPRWRHARRVPGRAGGARRSRTAHGTSPRTWPSTRARPPGGRPGATATVLTTQRRPCGRSA